MARTNDNISVVNNYDSLFIESLIGVTDERFLQW